MKKFTLLLAAAMLSSLSFATTFEKVTSAPADWTGEYLLVYENSKTEAYVWDGVDAALSYDTVAIADGVIDAADLVTFKIAALTEGYSILINGGTNDGKYIGKSVKSNGIDFGTTAVKNTLAYQSELKCSEITAAGGCKFLFYATTGQSRFRYYKTTQKSIQLYKKVAGAEIPATAIALDASALNIEQYKSTKLTATLTPAEATTEVVWTSSDENVATVANGIVTAVGIGTATITATAGVGVEATCTVTISAPTILTCAEAATMALSVSANNELYANGQYVVRGYVTEIPYAYSASSGNLSVWLADTKTGENTIEAYKAVPVSEVEQALAVGDYVEVVGDLTKFNKTPELAAGCSIKKLADPTTAISNATVAEKAVKMIENGQLVIVREDVKYNAQGVVIR